jgi:A/G-specific adenine glycosylase
LPRSDSGAPSRKVELSGKEREAVRRALLDWYAGSARDLPWRRKPEPYAVWVSEVMLQQTQVETVKGYFSRWMQRFPTVKALAAATESDVLHAWQGLGYYSRARNLWRGAQAVVERHGGRVPHEHDALLALPGVGPYSAGAILSIAHGKAAAIVDGNVVRVLCRLFGLRGDPTRAPLKSEIWALATELVPESRPGDFNQSMMELGATVCTPRSPACLTCPLMKRCAARRQGLETTLPELPKRRATVDVARAAAVVRRGAHVLSVLVPATASRWAGMWQFPNTDVGGGETAESAARRAVHEALGARVPDGERLLTVRHAVTHHRITLDVFAYALPSGAARRMTEGLAWKRPSELHELAMPSAHRRIAKALEDGE